MTQIKYISETRAVDMADEWFDIAGPDHFWIQWRYNALQKQNILSRNKNNSILEIGCGNGIAMKQFESNGYKIDGCDLNLHALKKIENVKGNVMLYDIYERDQNLISKYSSVVLFDVIEHIDDDADFIRTALLHLKPSGMVIVNVPAINMLFSEYDVVAGHKRRYSKKQIEALFKETGVEPLSVNYWGFLLLPIALLRKITLLFIKKEDVIDKGFKPPGQLIHRILKAMMTFELKFFPKPILGTSVIAVGRKK